MTWEEVIDYIQRSSTAGLDEDTIKINLLKARVDKETIKRAFRIVKTQTGEIFQKEPEFHPPASSTNIQKAQPVAQPPPISPSATEKGAILSNTKKTSPVLPPQSAKPEKPTAPFSPLPESLIKDFKLKEEQPTSFFSSFFSPKSYTGILYGTRRISWVLILLIIAFINSFLPSFNLIKLVYPVVDNLGEKVEETINRVYPEELEVKIKNGFVSVNVPEPYFINVPKETLNVFLPSKKRELLPVSQIRLLAIDTKGKAEEFEKYQALALLTSTSLVYYSDNKVNIQSLRNIQDLTINKEFIFSKFREFNKNDQIEIFSKLFLILTPFFIFLMMLLLAFISLSFISFLMWIITKIKQVDIRFGQVFAYTTALALVPILVLSVVSFILPFNLAQNSTVSSIFILGLGYTFLNQKENDS